MTKGTNLTTLEYNALRVAIDNAGNNGYDFGIVEECRWGNNTASDRQAFGALLVNLQKKGHIEIHETMYVNSTTTYRRDRRAPGGFREIRKGGDAVTQYTLSQAIIDDVMSR